MAGPLIPTRHRLPDWEYHLFTFLHGLEGKAFEWGRFDCAVGLVAGAVKAQTGVDVGLPHIGQYGDEKAALKHLTQLGWRSKGDDMEASLTKAMDSVLRREQAGRRHRGNILLLQSADGFGFGVRDGFGVTRLTPDGPVTSRVLGYPKEWTVTHG